jgi:hypothetical protein
VTADLDTLLTALYVELTGRIIPARAAPAWMTRIPEQIHQIVTCS